MAGVGNRTGIISGITDSFLDEEPDMKGKLVVFDPQVFNRTKGLLTDWTQNRDQWKSAFNKWSTDFNAATPEIASNVARENDYLKYLRDGGFEKTLSSLRTRERANDLAEKENALDFASGDANRAKLASGAGVGSSSADFARRLRSGARIEAEFGGRDTARERSDLSWVNQSKLSTMGMINKNIDALINRQLTPQQLTDHELVTMIQGLQGIQGLRMGSASPVFWREKSGLEKFGDVADSLAEGAIKGANAAKTFSGMGSIGGGMGGGGAAPAGQTAGASAEAMGGGPNPGGMPQSWQYQPQMFNYSNGGSLPPNSVDYNMPSWRDPQTSYA